MYQAQVSGKDSMYVVETDGPHCDCIGFRYYRTCKHLVAARMLEEACS